MGIIVYTNNLVKGSRVTRIRGVLLGFSTVPNPELCRDLETFDVYLPSKQGPISAGHGDKVESQVSQPIERKSVYSPRSLSIIVPSKSPSITPYRAINHTLSIRLILSHSLKKIKITRFETKQTEIRPRLFINPTINQSS